MSVIYKETTCWLDMSYLLTWLDMKYCIDVSDQMINRMANKTHYNIF